MAAVFVSFDKKPSIEEIKEKWAAFAGAPQELGLPSAPKQFLRYFEEADRPQTQAGPQPGKRHGGVDRHGCARTPSTTTNLCASPTTPCAGRPAAAVLLAELLAAKGYV